MYSEITLSCDLRILFVDTQDEIVREFIIETSESLDRLDRLFVQLEQNPSEREAINDVFRIIHTIKGTCGFLELFKLEQITHSGEQLLASLRSGKIQLNTEVISALLKLVDSVREILCSIEQSGSEGDFDHSELAKQLTLLEQNISNTDAHGAGCSPDACFSSPQTEVQQDILESVLHGVLQPPAPNFTVAEISDPTEFIARMIKSMETARSNEDPMSGADSKIRAAYSTIRVDVGLLDSLMVLVSELVSTRNQLLKFTQTQNEPSLVPLTQQLDLITSELQESVMQTRMQPVMTIWNKFPKIIRDVAQVCGKQVRLEMEGEDTELDRAILEAVKDPLTHIVRNSVDHGIEPPDVRVAQGKNPVGVLALRAFREGRYVSIEIRDDGAGLNVERLKKKVLEKGLIARDRLEAMSEQEIHRVIFLPGFSTAEQVTSISGRGVGMDVVLANIEQIGGTVDLISKAGYGTAIIITFRMHLRLFQR